MKRRKLLRGLLITALVCTSAAFAADGPAAKGNAKSKVYHKPGCRHYNAKGSTVAFQSEDEAKQAGYKICKQCSKAATKKKAEPAE
jgi:methylphosphotriester-DNA--protein-cysteine methyltransferase